VRPWNGRDGVMERQMVEIGLFEVSKALNGGNVYELRVAEALSTAHNVETVSVAPNGKRFLPMTHLRTLAKLAAANGEKDVWIRSFLPIAGLSLSGTTGANIGLFYHHAPVRTDFRYVQNRIIDWLLYRNIRRLDAVVAISQHWRSYLERRGCRNVQVIYPSLDLSQFTFDEEEVTSFLARHGLEGKPVLYLGNCQTIKGVVEAHQALKDSGFHLVTSGRRRADVPTVNLDLSYRDYLLLLKASAAAVTMSLFDEGWCITAHEAMLCRTPVIGSGRGGMRELLEGGGQFVCSSFDELPSLVQRATTERERLGEVGYRYASQFTLDRFRREWLALIDTVRAERMAA